MRDHLHDEIDAAEEFRDRANDIVEQVFKRVPQLARQSKSMDELLTAIAALVGNDSAALTTEATKVFFELGAKRSRIAGGVG